MHHAPAIDGSRGWAWNGSEEMPTISPSVLVTGVRGDTGEEALRCHSFVREGRIEYLSDCLHEMAGKTVDLEPIEQHPVIFAGDAP